MHANNICHFAIHAHDVARAKRFYEQVFAWRFEPWGPPDFYLIHTGNSQHPGILGALQQRTEPVSSGFNGYECSISVADVQATEALVIKHGGTVMVRPMEIPQVGVLIRFADTEGNHVCAIHYFHQG